MKRLAAANIEKVLLRARVELQRLDRRCRLQECDVRARADASVENCGPQRHHVCRGRIGVGPISCGVPIAGEAQPSRILRVNRNGGKRDAGEQRRHAQTRMRPS
jgi:hypothetical protein